MTDGRLDRGALVRQLLEQHAWSCALPLAEKAVVTGVPPRAIDVGSMLLSQPAALPGGPLVTVAVCNRSSAAELQPCLDSLLSLDYTPLDLAGHRCVGRSRAGRGARSRSVPDHSLCTAPGITAVSRLAMAESRGDVLAITHGDAVVDRRWISRLVAVFLADPEVMSVSGLTLPRSIGRPMRAVLPAGAPFCREWSRVEVDGMQSIPKMLERFGANVALWRPDTSVARPYTHVFEPAAIVRAAAASPASLAGPRRVPLTNTTRNIDLGDAIQTIADADAADEIMLNVSWCGASLGTAHIAHHGVPVSPLWVADAIAQQLTVEVLDARLGVGEHVCRALLTADLARHIVGRLGLAARGGSAAATKKASGPRRN